MRKVVLLVIVLVLGCCPDNCGSYPLQPDNSQPACTCKYPQIPIYYATIAYKFPGDDKVRECTIPVTFEDSHYPLTLRLVVASNSGQERRYLCVKDPQFIQATCLWEIAPDEGGIVSIPEHQLLRIESVEPTAIKTDKNGELIRDHWKEIDEARRTCPRHRPRQIRR